MKRNRKSPSDQIVYFSIFEKRHHKKEPSKKFIKRWFMRGRSWAERLNRI